MKKDDILEEERLLSKKRVPDVIRRTRILHVKDFLEAHTDEEYSTSMADIIRACFLIHNHAKSMNYQKENASRMSNIYTRGEANGINDSTV